MNLLILGGTIFLGRHLTESALARGHTVTLFNRGNHAEHFPPADYPTVEQLRGDRDGQLAALRGRRWDAVIDTCGYVPRVVQLSAELLADQVAQYVFISSISVYADFGQAGIDEHAALGELADPTTEEVTGESYGPLKARCEVAAENAMPGRVLTVRPGLIVGPHDPTDRFTYWPARIARGGDVLAPGDPAQQVQFIDGRDLADWILRMVEMEQNGIYNATGPATPLSMGEFLATCQQERASDASLTWVPEAFLVDAEVGAFVELPLWVPQAMAGIEQVDCTKAIQAGLTFRPIAATIDATLAWHQTRTQPVTWRAGLSAEREAALLAQWRATCNE